MKIGICSTVDKIEKIEELGFDYIEIPVTSIANLNDDEFMQMVEKVKKSKIKCEAFNLLFPKNIRLVGKDIDKDVVKEYIAVALKRVNILDGKVVVFGSGGARRCPDDLSYDEAWRQMIEICSLLGNEAAKYGITIVIEPLNKSETNIINSVAEGLKLVKDVNHPNIKLLADFYHMRVENEEMAIIKKAESLLRHCHIANNHERAYPLKDEEDDYKSFFGALKNVNYNERLSIEGRTQQFDIDAPVSLALLKKMSIE